MFIYEKTHFTKCVSMLLKLGRAIYFSNNKVFSMVAINKTF